MTSSIVQFARHGKEIPAVRSGDFSNFRIGNHQVRIRYEAYELVNFAINSETVPDLIARAGANPERLFILTHAEAHEGIRAYEGLYPANVMSALKLTGIELHPDLDYSGLLEVMIKTHGDEFIKAGSFSKWQSSRYQKQVERAIRSKSILDEWFYHVPYGVTTLHQIAAEFRDERSVLGYDFNGMYPSCLGNHNYPNPARLRYGAGNGFLKACLESGIAGAFKCLIRDPDAFMVEHFMQAASYGDTILKIELPDKFIAVLHVNEIQFWSDHAQIETIEGVYSFDGITHPLAALANKIYHRKDTDDRLIRAMVKQELVLMHSSTARSGFRHVSLHDARELYGFSESFTSQGEESFLRLPSINDPANVLCLQRQVLANARIKLLTEIKRLNKLCPEAQLCYANVDSLHFSMPQAVKPKFQSLISTGTEMGALKLEFEGNRGLWLDPGRWWIKDDCKLVAFRTGTRYDSADAYNMSLHQQYLDPAEKLIKVAPMRAPASEDSVNEEVADLTAKNVEIVRKLWKRFVLNAF